MFPLHLALFARRGVARPRIPGNFRQIDLLQRRLREDIQKVHKEYRRDLVLYRDERLPERR